MAKTLYVALANRDVVAAVNVARGPVSVKGYFDTRLPGQSYFGAEPLRSPSTPMAAALCGQLASDAVAVIDTGKLTMKASKAGHGRAHRICAHGVDADVDGIHSSPAGGKLYVATDKGKGTGPNNFPQRRGGKRSPATNRQEQRLHRHASLRLTGHARRGGDRKNLTSWTKVVLASNRMKARRRKIVCRRRAESASSTSSTSSKKTAPTIRSLAT
jgi:hypothetical protein